MSMADAEGVKAWIEENKVIAIVRRVYGEDLVSLAAALSRGGVKLIECTFDQVDPRCIEKTAQAIRALSDSLGDAVMAGAGTVLSVDQVEAAYAAGSRYIISPNVNESVIRRTKELGMVSIPGAMTPTEILAAHDAGADYVKLFPAATLGFGYIKDIMAPITHVKLIATGGVTEDNYPEFLKRGFVGAGVGGRLSTREFIERNDWAEFERRARAFSDITKECANE